jgi:hypothetical protein
MPSEIEGEPVCPDFELGAGRTPMRGSLRLPVMLTILDGKTPIMKTAVIGRRTEKEPSARTVLADVNEEYTVEWAQCENERAPRPVVLDRKAARDTVETSAYQCGTATPYKTESLVTKKGDLSSHKLVFAQPPKPECWVSEMPLAADAGAPDAAADAGEQDGAAGTAPAADPGASDAGVADAAVAPEASAKDAGRTGGGAKPAGTTKTKKAE